MKLEDQVVSLELAQRMKELGFEQESLFYWRHSFMRGWRIISTMTDLIARNLVEESFCSAYTVAELGEMLPDMWVYSYPEFKDWVCQVDNWYEKPAMHKIFETPPQKSHFRAKTEADSRAKMLIYLKENNLL